MAWWLVILLSLFVNPSFGRQCKLETIEELKTVRLYYESVNINYCEDNIDDLVGTSHINRIGNSLNALDNCTYTDLSSLVRSHFRNEVSIFTSFEWASQVDTLFLSDLLYMVVDPRGCLTQSLAAQGFLKPELFFDHFFREQDRVKTRFFSVQCQLNKYLSSFDEYVKVLEAIRGLTAISESQDHFMDHISQDLHQYNLDNLVDNIFIFHTIYCFVRDMAPNVLYEQFVKNQQRRGTQPTETVAPDQHHTTAPSTQMTPKVDGKSAAFFKLIVVGSITLGFFCMLLPLVGLRRLHWRFVYGFIKTVSNDMKC
ncbi:hypothetical protein RF11_12311 [Thelohanellus kitauei]|uniref:Uncharacterized protein n=1 Tax=Thelohanellus kitauei TaxID=669202 RepID=A0A0C2MZZ5_THEKT|nr:hypothetical protein RF11_12311 [Thelohanellus kitauei]